MIAALPAWLGSGHERRAKLFACFALASLLVTTVGVIAAPDQPRVTVENQRPDSNTLVALQGYHDEGRAVEITPNGEVAWEYAKTDDMFDVEALGPDRVQLSTATEMPDKQCPSRYQNDGNENCVRNSLRIVEKSSKEILWEYAWYDVELHEHELHDADHYTVNGEDRWAMVDMGNDRVFAVNRQKEIVWEWNATDTYERPDGMGPEGDWTHVNDVDRLRPGVFQISLRNFDTVAELHVQNDSVTVKPILGPDSYEKRGKKLHEQHNPDRLADGNLLVADSEGDRVVEFDRSGNAVWQFGGSGTLNWPRDADRLSSGHTLVTDSYNDRVVEVDESGTVVWAVETGGLPYEADRLPAEWSENARGEGSADRPTAPEAKLADGGGNGSLLEHYGGFVIAMAKYVLPTGLGEQIFPIMFGVVSLFGAVIEGVRWRK